MATAISFADESDLVSVMRCRLKVDKEMLQYGRYISQQLHNGSLSLKRIGIQEVNAAAGSRI